MTNLQLVKLIDIAWAIKQPLYNIYPSEETGYVIFRNKIFNIHREKEILIKCS